MDRIIAYFADEWHVVGQAPATFGVGVALFAALAYAAAAWRFGRKIDGLESANSTLKERMQLRDDRAAEYERNLRGASPDEAKARVESLEQRVAELTPRRLSPDQKLTIARGIAAIRGAVMIFHDAAAPDTGLLARDFAEAFGQAGWEPQIVSQYGFAAPQALHATIYVPGNAANAALTALRAADLEFSVATGVEPFGRRTPGLALGLGIGAKD